MIESFVFLHRANKSCNKEKLSVLGMNSAKLERREGEDTNRRPAIVKNTITGPCCVVACWWLWGVAVVGSSPSPSSPASLPGIFRLTFWPRFYHPRNYLRNQAGKNVGPCSTSFCTEFRCASCWHSHLSRWTIF